MKASLATGAAFCICVGLIVLALGGWGKVIHRAPKPKVMTIRDDWVMGSWSAVSNATAFGVPAPGYRVGWSTNGTFCPMKGDTALTYNSMIRASYWQALVGTWRDYEVVQGSAPKQAQ